MKIKEELKKIQSEISDIHYMITTFEKTNSIPEIDLDICLEKIRTVYSDLKTINDIKAESPNEEYIDSFEVEDTLTNEEEEELVVDEIEEDPELEIKPIEEIEEEPEAEVNIAEQIIEETEEEPAVEVKKEKTVEKAEKLKEPSKLIEKPKQQINTPTKITNKQTIGDKISSDKRSLNDLISQNKIDKDLSSQYKKKKIENLNKAISLNDKIWFTKELFNGNNSEFNSILNSINSAPNLEEALNIITDNHDWDGENKIVQKFLSIITRRFQ